MAEGFAVEIHHNEGKIVPEDQIAYSFLQEYAKSNNLAKDMRNRPATGRNFEVVTNGSDDSMKVMLRKNDGREIDLADLFLAKGFKIARGDQGFMQANSSKRLISADPANASRRGFVLSLLHEFGHSYQEKPDVDRTNLTFKQKLEYQMAAIRGGAILLKNIVQIKGHSNSKSEERARLQNVVKSTLPNWYMDQFDTSLAKNEREGWAFALTKARELESMGFNVLSEFGSVQEVKDYVAATLFQEEYHRFERTIKNKGQENYAPKFVHLKAQTMVSSNQA